MAVLLKSGFELSSLIEADIAVYCWLTDAGVQGGIVKGSATNDVWTHHNLPSISFAAPVVTLWESFTPFLEFNQHGI